MSWHALESTTCGTSSKNVLNPKTMYPLPIYRSWWTGSFFAVMGRYHSISLKQPYSPISYHGPLRGFTKSFTKTLFLSPDSLIEGTWTSPLFLEKRLVTNRFIDSLELKNNRGKQKKTEMVPSGVWNTKHESNHMVLILNKWTVEAVDVCFMAFM